MDKLTTTNTFTPIFWDENKKQKENISSDKHLTTMGWRKKNRKKITFQLLFWLQKDCGN